MPMSLLHVCLNLEGLAGLMSRARTSSDHLQQQRCARRLLTRALGMQRSPVPHCNCLQSSAVLSTFTLILLSKHQSLCKQCTHLPDVQSLWPAHEQHMQS